MAARKGRTKRRRRAHRTTTHRRVRRRRAYRRNPSLFGKLHLPGAQEVLGGVAAAIGGPMIARMLMPSATGLTSTLAQAGGGLAAGLAAGMVLGPRAGAAGSLVGVVLPVAAFVNQQVFKSTPVAGYSISDDAFAGLGAYPDGFSSLQGYPAGFSNLQGPADSGVSEYSMADES